MPKKKNPTPTEQLPISAHLIERRIYLIRGQKVMLDSDLAELYQVETFNLNKAVKRNVARFPDDFMFQLSKEEFQNLRFQIGISSSGYGGRRYLPYAFTEQGVAMLSSVLNSDRAITVNIAIMRAFVKIRELLASHKDLAQKVEMLESTQKKHAGTLQQHSSVLLSVVQDIQRLKNPPVTRAIGFLMPPKPKKK